MAHVEHFEDLIAWQKSRILTREVYSATRSGTFNRDFGLKDQIQRASVSIMANTAEGFERERPNEFHQFLSIAKSSCAETRSHLYVAFDAGHLTEEEFKRLHTLATEVGRIVGGFRASVEKFRT